MRKGLWCAGAALRSALRWMRERLRPFMWHQSPSSTEVSAATQSRCHLDLLVAGWLNTCRIDLDSDAQTLTDLSSQSTYLNQPTHKYVPTTLIATPSMLAAVSSDPNATTPTSVAITVSPPPMIVFAIPGFGAICTA
jgi:hypothetical protein